MQGNLSDYTTEDTQKIKETVAVILKCTADNILMSGLYQATSFLVVISIKQELKRNYCRWLRLTKKNSSD